MGVLYFPVGVEPSLKLDTPPSLNRHDSLDYVDCVRTAHRGLQLVVELLVVQHHARGHLLDLDVEVELGDAVDTELDLVVVHASSLHVLNASLLQVHPCPRADQLGCRGFLCISGLVEALDLQSAILDDEFVRISVRKLVDVLVVEHVVHAERHFLIGEGVIGRPAPVRPITHVEPLRYPPTPEVVIVLQSARPSADLNVEGGDLVDSDAMCRLLFSAALLVLVSFLDAGLRVGPMQ